MTRAALLPLPDGRLLPYRIRSSRRTRTLRLTVTGAGLSVSAPAWLRLPEIMAAVAGNTDWIADRLHRFEEAWRLRGETADLLPQEFALPALGETWRVDYRDFPGRPTAARTNAPGRLLVAGEIHGRESCRAALRRWLARRAKEALGPRLEELALATGLDYGRLTVRNQRTRWGSCSAQGAISLNCKLLFLPPDLATYVLLHELCHTREHNHTGRFWALLRMHEPEAPALHQRMRTAWQQIPTWAQPGIQGDGQRRTGHWLQEFLRR